MLNIDEIKEKIKVRNEQIEEAILLEKRLQLHTLETVKLPSQNIAYINFLSWVEEAMGDQKRFSSFKNLVTTPIDTVSFTNSMYLQISKIFATLDYHKSYNFRKKENEYDFLNYLDTKKYTNWFEDKGFELFKNNICSFIVVDTEEGTANRKNPFFYFVDIERVYDACFDENNDVKHLLFCLDKDEYMYIDAERFVTIRKQDSRFFIENEVVHNFGFVPVKQFWQTNLNNKNKFVKQSAITNVLGKMDKLLFSMIAKEDSQMYAKFPILWEYEQGDDYSLYGQEQFFQGETNSTDEVVDEYQAYRKNTIKQKSAFRGGGAKIKKPLPNENSKDLGEPAGFISADVVSLDFIKKDIEDRKNEIFYEVLGSEKVKNQAREQINELQVQSNFEDAENVLMRIKTNFEIIEQWLMEKLAIIRYGQSEVISVVIDYGTQFFLKNTRDIEGELRELKESNSSELLILSKMYEQIDYRFKNQVDELHRTKFLLNIEPFPTKSVNEVIEINKTFPLSQKQILKKIYFSEIIAKFENQYGSIMKFAIDKQESERINEINSILDNYITNYVNG